MTTPYKAAQIEKHQLEIEFEERLATGRIDNKARSAGLEA
jgi:hypothetical protein